MLGGGDFPTENTTAWGCLASLFQNSFIKGRGFPLPSYFRFFPPRYTNGETPFSDRLNAGIELGV